MAMPADAALRRGDILQALQVNKALLKDFGVVRLSLLGSFARDEARQDSDIDLSSSSADRFCSSLRG